MKTRLELLNSLIEFKQPLSSILSSLKTFPWDSDEVLVTFQKEHLIHVVNQYLNNHFSASDVENWANAIEGREDIGYATQDKDILNDLIFELANPILTSPLSPDIAREYLIKLSDLRFSTQVSN